MAALQPVEIEIPRVLKHHAGHGKGAAPRLLEKGVERGGLAESVILAKGGYSSAPLIGHGRARIVGGRAAAAAALPAGEALERAALADAIARVERAVGAFRSAAEKIGGVHQTVGLLFDQDQELRNRDRPLRTRKRTAPEIAQRLKMYAADSRGMIQRKA